MHHSCSSGKTYLSSMHACSVFSASHEDLSDIVLPHPLQTILLVYKPSSFISPTLTHHFRSNWEDSYTLKILHKADLSKWGICDVDIYFITVRLSDGKVRFSRLWVFTELIKIEVRFSDCAKGPVMTSRPWSISAETNNDLSPTHRG